jgi:hypothetical protein
MDEQDNPVLQMHGAGKEIWTDEDPDEYVRRLRENWFGDDTDLVVHRR